MDIKKVIKEIYRLDYTNISIDSGEEFILNARGINEFCSYFKRYDIENGIIVIPMNYDRGLFYLNNDTTQAIYSSPRRDPEIVKFTYSIMGLKKNCYYRIRVVAKSTGDDYSITENRSITIVDNYDSLIMDYDFKNNLDYVTIDRIFLSSNDTELILKVSIGKIIIKDIIIDEVDIIDEEHITNIIDSDPNIVLGVGVDTLAAYGYFDITNTEITDLRFTHIHKISGIGIILTYDKTEDVYIIERDNVNESIIESLSSLKYYIEFNFCRIKNAISYDYIEPCIEFSPTTMKQGYYKFKFNNKISGTLLIKVKKVV